MRILIAGGRSHADFLIGSLKRERHVVVAVNDDETYCEYLAACHDVAIVHGDPTKRYVLDMADIEGFDVAIALSSSDADNLVICQMAKRFYGIAKTVCTVTDPQNVAVFKRLGVPIVISEALIISEALKEASTVEALALNIEDVEREIYPSFEGGFSTGSFEAIDPASSGLVPRVASEAR